MSIRTTHWYRWLAGVAALAVVGALAVAGLAAADGTGWRHKVDSSVLSSTAVGNTEFLVYLKERADLSGAYALDSKEAKGRYVYDQLTSVAKRTQAPLLEELNRLGAQHQSFWITNAISVVGGQAALEAMAESPEVDHIYAAGVGGLDPPVSVPGGANGGKAANLALAVGNNISHVNADDVWALGYTGQGAVVASADTGVEWTHPALQGNYRGWNGSTANHDYNWHDGNPNPANPFCPPSGPEPCDDDEVIGGGHGTHTTGTMVGDDGAGNQIGMAPGAKWIACRNMNQGVGVIPTYLSCMQWFIAPTKIGGADPDPSKAPDVVNNSWGCIEICPPPALRDTLQASRAAGIFYAVSAGNDGVGAPGAPGCSTLEHPLARYTESFTVGATYIGTDAIAEFSSRGPVLGDPEFPTGLMKPNISAPGVDVRSSVRGGGYNQLSGTSMAGPHVAGLVALIISANSDLRGDVDGIEDLIEETAVHLTTNEGCGFDGTNQVPNNTFGWGRIDALAAVSAAAAMATPDLVISSMQATNNTGSGKNKQPRAGDKVTVSATITNIGSGAAPATTTELVLDGATVLGSKATPALESGASATVEVSLDTRGMKGEHTVDATADKASVAAESEEGNNTGRLTFEVHGNKVKNPSFEQSNAQGSAPANWSGKDTQAGDASWSSGGSDGQKSATITGTGGNVVLSGVPTWTSDAVDVTAGETLDLVVSVRSVGASSAPGAGLVYLGAAGQVVDTVKLITAPLTTAGFQTLERTVTIPAGVAQVHIVLSGFAATDLATAGTVTFDDIGLFGH